MITVDLVCEFQIGESDGLNAIVAGNAAADVYNASGVCVLRNATAEQMKSLPAGIYIANGKKFVVR